MIQPISNISFNGGIYLGGKEYSALKAMAGNVQQISNPKIQATVQEGLTNLRQHMLKIVPQDKELAVLFKQTGGLTENSTSKISIAVKDLTAENAPSLFSLNKEIVSSKEDKLKEIIEGIFTKTVYGTAQNLGQNINKLI